MICQVARPQNHSKKIEQKPINQKEKEKGQKPGYYMCFKSRMHNFDGPPTTLETEHRTRLQAWFNTYDVSFPTSRRRLGEGVFPRMCSNFIWSSMGHIYIYTPIQCANNFESWSLDEANPTIQRWQIRALLAVGYHLHSTRFCHMQNLEDSMVQHRVCLVHD